MRKSIKAKVISILSAIIIIATIPTSTLASTLKDHSDYGNGTGGGSSSSAYTWNVNQSGYRICFVNQQFKQVSNTVDFLFSNVSSNITFGNNRYTNSRANALSTDIKNWTDVHLDSLYNDGKISTYPPYPVDFQQSGSGYISTAGGEAFKNWFLKSQGGLSSIVTYVPQPQPDAVGNTTVPAL